MLKKMIVALACMAVIAFLIGYNSGQANETGNKAEPTFVTVEESYEPVPYIIVYHKDTKVMYYISKRLRAGNGTMTLLVNADGTPMLYDEQ